MATLEFDELNMMAYLPFYSFRHRPRRRCYSWFRQNKWASFQRQLNHYDFKRITTGTSVLLLLEASRVGDHRLVIGNLTQLVRIRSSTDRSRLARPWYVKPNSCIASCGTTSTHGP
jgi:HSF-type DNA-binding